MADVDGASFLTGANAEFIAGLYARFLEDPASIDDSWRQFFAELGDDGAAMLDDLRPVRDSRSQTAAIGAGARDRSRRVTPSDCRFDPRSAADPRLSGARPSRSRSRPAAARPARALS